MKVSTRILPLSRDLRDTEQQARQLVREDEAVTREWSRRVAANPKERARIARKTRHMRIV